MKTWGDNIKRHRNCYNAAEKCCGEKKASEAFHNGKELFPNDQTLIKDKCCSSCSFFDALPRCKSFVETGIQADFMEPLSDCKRFADGGDCTKDGGMGPRTRR